MRRKIVIAILLTATCVVCEARLQNGGFRPRSRVSPEELAAQNPPYDGRFAFVRLRFDSPPAGYYYRGLPAWAHGYPRAETNLMRIVTDISGLKPRIDGGAFALDDP